nr:DUF6760 family protein [Nodosilinea sp. TSF1-S3]
MPAGLCRGARPAGGIVGYPLARLYEEVAYLAYHFHWGHADLMALEHGDRQRWVAEVAEINQQINRQSGEPGRENFEF